MQACRGSAWDGIVSDNLPDLPWPAPLISSLLSSPLAYPPGCFPGELEEEVPE